MTNDKTNFIVQQPYPSRDAGEIKMSSDPQKTIKVPYVGSYDLSNRRVVVVGGGVSGLATAHFLKKRGVIVDLIEKENFVGGMLRSTLKEERYIVELGPQAFAETEDSILAIARELSIDGLIVGKRRTPSERYLFSRDRLHTVPRGAVSLIRSSLFPNTKKIKMLAASLIPKRCDMSGSLASIINERWSPMRAEAVLDPFTSNAWAGDSEELEAASVIPKSFVDSDEQTYKHCSNFFDKQVPGLFSFKWGMGTLTARLEEILRASVRTGLVCTSVERKSSGGVAALIDRGRTLIDADAIVIAIPAYAASGIIKSISPELSSHLTAISYAPLAAIHTAFKTQDIPSALMGAGFVVQRNEGIRLLGAVFPSCLFPGRCPLSEQLITCFIGGALDQEAVELSDAELIEIAKDGLNKTLGINASPCFTYVKRSMHAIPQFTIGHAERISKINKLLEGQSGIFMTGGYLAGPTVSDAISHARETAGSIAEYLRKLI